MTDEQADDLCDLLVKTSIIWLKENRLAGSIGDVSLYHELFEAVTRYQQGVKP